MKILTMEFVFKVIVAAALAFGGLKVCDLCKKACRDCCKCPACPCCPACPGK